MSKFGRRTYDAFRSAALPDLPTDAAPGTSAKIQVMAERAARRQLLFHPLDNDQMTVIIEEVPLLGLVSLWEED